MRKVLLSGFLSALLAAASLSQSVNAAEAPQAAGVSTTIVDSKVVRPKFIKVPVFYITDRNRVKDGPGGEPRFGIDRKFPGRCNHHLDIGVAYCSIRNRENKELAAPLKDIGWTVADKSSEGSAGTTPIESSDYEQAKATFYGGVQKAASLAKNQEVFMFVPGYMSTFESGLRSAARLGYYAERPVMLFSWASKGKFSEYMADESTVEWSQEHFNDVLEALNSMSKKEHGIHVRLFAHSMGGRLILRATHRLKGNPAISEVSVVCPDVDDGVVKHYADKCFDGSSKLTLRLYTSKADKMLKLSQLVHGGYSRFGEEDAPLDVLLPTVSEAASNSNQSEEQQNSNAIADATSRRMVTIDFTAIDIRPLGHRIPVELVASMSENAQPAKGMVFRLYQPSRSKSSAASGHESDDAVLKVQRTTNWHGIPVPNAMIAYRPRLRLLFTKDWTLN